MGLNDSFGVVKSKFFLLMDLILSICWSISTLNLVSYSQKYNANQFFVIPGINNELEHAITESKRCLSIYPINGSIGFWVIDS